MPKFTTILKRLAARTGVARTAADQIFLRGNKADVTFYSTMKAVVPYLDPTQITVYPSDLKPGKRCPHCIYQPCDQCSDSPESNGHA